MLSSASVETLFQILAILQILAGLYLIYQAMEWRGYARRRMFTDPGFFAPRTAVLCPCKGMEPGLEQNLNSLCEFNHQNYEVFFILASETDPAAGLVKRVASQSKVKAHLIFAGQPQGCSEKVNNLRVAIEQLPPEFEVLVFTDSDGRPGRSWLHHLVAPLNDSRTGATTTMRWLIPNRSNFATLLLAAWNAPLVSMLSEKGKNFCWGGGTAIRRTIFDQINVLEEWQGSVSDDYSLTAAIERSGRPIVFLPECLTVSFAETDFQGLLEFTNRQILITRVYSPKMWGIAFATHALFCITVVLGTILTLGNLIATLPALPFAGLTFLPFLLAAIRASLRTATVSELLPVFRPQIMGQSWVYIILGLFLPFLFLVNFVSSTVTRKIVWRGIRYEVISPQQTRILSH
ncbi:MAG TPA: glycosyltransferase family 2 protein [Terriglobales bacterium]|nr:glycosyltransferase family 2 protein [Terriglobales bacterium]